MSSDEDRDDHVYYGTALEPLEEESVIRKKPVALQDQIVTDEHGRRRFHGAFTGGFSAGYYNTVGSKEGWKPSSFKSTRDSRSSFRQQNVEDFMDDDDMGVFGIAPKVLQPTDDFSSKKKQLSKRSGATTGAIPGDPILLQMIEPVRETVGIKILKKLGWRPGQGIGPTEMRSRKRHQSAPKIQDDGVKIYGCVPPPAADERTEGDYSSTSEEEELLDIAPVDAGLPSYKPKDNRFGLGYSGLDRNALGSTHVNLFGPSLTFKVENKSMNIAGEAFGIGVFEDKDEEVYSKEDMSDYDFSLETAEERKSRLRKEAKDRRRKRRFSSEIPGYVKAKNPVLVIQYYPPPELPPDYRPVHAQKRSRFDVAEREEPQAQKLGLDRHKFTREERNLLLGDPKNRAVKPQAVAQEVVPSLTSAPIALAETTALVEESNRQRIERLKKFAEVLQQHSSNKLPSATMFKPFVSQPGKQERYEQYMTLKTAGYGECLKDLQPSDMTEWEREREKMEFERAALLYKPLANEISSRFVSAKSHDISHAAPEKEVKVQRDPSEDPKTAAKMNMFGKLTHKEQEWHPHNVVCKRFNVPNPFPHSNMIGTFQNTLKQTEEVITSSCEIQPEITVPTAKKSLFDNLDFTKPPPGLFPTVAASASTASNLQSEENQKTVLEGGTESKPDLPAVPMISAVEPIVKPPLDLFKEIFADSSESEDEQPPVVAETEKQGHVVPKPREHHIKAHTIEQTPSQAHGATTEPDKSVHQSSRRSDSVSRLAATTSENPHPTPVKIFDNLDLNSINKPPKPESLQKMEDEEDSYGPAPPKVPPSSTSGGSSNVAMRHIFSSSKSKANEPIKDGSGNLWIEKSETPSSSSRKRSKKKKVKEHRHKSKTKKRKSESSHKKHKKAKHRKTKKTSKSRRRSSSGSGSNVSSDSSSESESDATSDEYKGVNLTDPRLAKALVSKLKEKL